MDVAAVAVVAAVVVVAADSLPAVADEHVELGSTLRDLVSARRCILPQPFTFQLQWYLSIKNNIIIINSLIN